MKSKIDEFVAWYRKYQHDESDIRTILDRLFREFRADEHKEIADRLEKRARSHVSRHAYLLMDAAELIREGKL